MGRTTRIRKAIRIGIFVTLSLVTAGLIIVLAYGPGFIDKRFNLVSASSAPSISLSAQSLHQSLTVADLHADSLLWGRELTASSNHGHVDVPRLLQGNVALQMFTVVTKVPTPLKLEGNRAESDSVIQLALLQRWPISTWFDLTERALYQARRLHRVERKMPDRFRVIETQEDLTDYLTLRQQNPEMTAGVLGLEGAHALNGQLDNIDRLFDAGFRMIGLAHFFDNEVGDSAHGLNRGGLTAFGKDVVRQLEDRKILIDLAHASPQMMDEVLDMAQRPVVVSHTGVQGTCPGVRNLSDRQLKQIAQTGGVIGIGFWPTAVCGEEVSAIARAIRYVVDQVGVESVALGSDFDGAVRVPFDVSRMNLVTNALLNEGFTEPEIQKIMGLNVIMLLQDNLPV